MFAKTRRCFAWMSFALLLVAGSVRAQEDRSVSASGHTWTGRVVDAEGKPLPDVEIWLPPTLHEKMGRTERRPAAVSGPDGLFRAQWSGETYTACPAGWLPAEHRPSFGFSGKPVEIRLRPATRLSGRVVDVDGEPVAGAFVRAQRAGWAVTNCVIINPPQPCAGHPSYRTGSTDAEGRFVFESLEPGWFAVDFEDGDRSRKVRWHGPAGESGDEVELVMSRKRVPVVGRVVDADGNPVEGAQVSVAGAEPIPTDGAGAFRVSRVFTGSRQVRVSHPDLGQVTREVRIEESPARLTVRMPRASLVEGRVAARDGSSVPKPRLTVDWQSVELDADGRFRLTLSQGEHVLRAQASGWISVEKRVTATGQPIELDLLLSRPATIAGRITGLPSGGHGAVELRKEAEERNGGIGANEDGRFRVYTVAPGTWTLVARDNNGRTVTRRVQVDEGSLLDVGDLHFPPLPAVRGRVLDPEGRPLQGVMLSFQQGERHIHADTDTEGRFTAHVADGTWTVKAERQGFGGSATTVSMSGAPAEIPDLRLVRTAALSGYVRGLAPGEVPFVMATSEDGLWKKGRYAQQDFRFHIPALWPGTWILTASLDGREASTRVHILPAQTEARADIAFGED